MPSDNPIENKDPANRARGYKASDALSLTIVNVIKAAINNPHVSQEAKEHSKQKLSEIRSQGYTSEESQAEARSTRYRESQRQNVANQKVAGEQEEEEPEMVEGEDGEISEDEE